jgi:hypothetical protein
VGSYMFIRASAWPIRPRVVPSTSGTAAAAPRPGGGTAQSTTPALADLTLVDAAGTQRRLRDELPGVIMLVENCACAELLASTSIATAEVGIALIAVGRSTAPAIPASTPSGARVWAAVDPQGVLWGWVPGSPGTNGTATVLLVDATGTVVRAVSTTSVDDFRLDLARLRSR